MKGTHRDIEYVIPGFADPKKQPMILAALKEYAMDMGFKESEMKDIRDRKILLAVYKAMMFDKLVHQQAKRK